MRLLRPLFALILVAALTGCGFHLRGADGNTLPYKTMAIALPETADVRIWLERHIRGSGTEIVADPKAAEAVFQQLADNRQKSILSVNAQGRVREYRLQLTYRFRLVKRQGRRDRRSERTQPEPRFQLRRLAGARQGCRRAPALARHEQRPW